MGKEPARFDGPFLIGHIPTDSPEIFVELIDGAQQCEIHTLGYKLDDGSRRAERDKRQAKGLVEERQAIPGERERFYAAIGFAISQWQHVEAALAGIFTSLTASSDDFASSAAFFAAVNFSVKLEMVDAAAEARLLTKRVLLQEWQKLSKEASSKATVRNNLAHFMSVVRISIRDKYRYYLEPSVFDPSNFGNEKAQRYNYVNIENQARTFGELAQKLSDFAPKLPRPAHS